jgi:hypothetical protein
MTLQFSTAVRNDMLDAIEIEIGTGPVLRILSGAKPANCAAAQTGTVLAEMSLPSDWMLAAASGVKAKDGTWSDLSANASGTAGYFRIYDSTISTCHIQGECTDTGGGGPMKLSTLAVVATEPVTVASFTLTAGNA